MLQPGRAPSVHRDQGAVAAGGRLPKATGGKVVLEILCPDEYHRSVHEIDLGALKKRGIEALIVDLDNTLLPWQAEEVSTEARAWVEHAKRLGFRLCIASNGLGRRVTAISHQLGVPAITRAVKPRKRPFRLALAQLGVEPHQVAVVGDQIFTDILGGKRMQLYTILIDPVSRQELGTTRVVRRVERRVLRRLSRRGLLPAAKLAARLADERELA